MKTVKFRRSLAEEILKGEKNSTWRLFDDKDVAAGGFLELVIWETGEKFAEAEAVEVREKKLEEIKENDFDGHEKFESLEKMLETFRTYYGDKVTMETPVKMIRFKLLQK